MQTEVQYSKMFSRICQITQKTEALLAMLRELSLCFRNRKRDLAIHGAIVRQRRILRRLISERARMIKSAKYAHSLCRPAATQYINKKMMNRAKCADKMDSLIKEAEKMQAEHFAQLLDSGGLPYCLENILEAHLQELRSVYDSIQAPPSGIDVIELPESIAEKKLRVIQRSS